MHGLAHRLIAAERERNIRDTARHMRTRQLIANALCRLDEINGIIIMLFNAGGDGENIRIENNIFRRKTDLLGQNLVRALANLKFAFCRIGLPVFVKCHDNHRRAIAQTRARLFKKRRFALFQ